jgi:hypothetical protein
MSTTKRRSKGWGKHKTARVTQTQKLQEAVQMFEDLKIQQQAAVRLQPSFACFDMQAGMSEKLQMVELLWACNFAPLLGELQKANPLITELMMQAVSNTYMPDDEELFMHKQALKFENLLAAMYRCQNQFKMPLWVVLRSVYAMQHGMHLESWNIESAVRLLASHRWTKDLIALATKHSPGAPFQSLAFVTAAVFDNFTVKIDYKSLHDLDHHGYRLDMTNWGSLTIPATTAPDLNIGAVIGSE